LNNWGELLKANPSTVVGEALQRARAALAAAREPCDGDIGYQVIDAEAAFKIIDAELAALTPAK